MDALLLVGTIAPHATVKEIGSRQAGGNRVFRLVEEDGRSTVLKVYGTPGRERRERHALEALAGVPGVPVVIDRGITADGTAWAQLTDGGGWNLQTLTKNLDVIGRAGRVLAAVHASKGRISNLEDGLDGDYIANHYISTIDRLGRYRRKLQIPAEVLSAAANAPTPVSSAPVNCHTRPTPDRFTVNEKGEVTLVDWEWSTLAPPEWDLSLAVWSLRTLHGDDAAEAFLAGYGSRVPVDRLDSWTAYHAATRLLEAGESSDGRLPDQPAIIAALARAVGL
jgi:aminoglycoside phosphotransferase (APT) family kinase protein